MVNGQWVFGLSRRDGLLVFTSFPSLLRPFIWPDA